MPSVLRKRIVSSTVPDAIRVAGVLHDSITDGPGLRFTLFVQGCGKRCPGCHNPQALPMEGGREFFAEELIALIRKNPLLTGVTFSGGEPLLQAVSLLPLAKMVREDGLDLAIYTGLTFEEIMEEADPDMLALLACADILVDGPFVMETRRLSLRFRGSENQRILDVPESLAAQKAVWTVVRDWTGS